MRLWDVGNRSAGGPAQGSRLVHRRRVQPRRLHHRDGRQRGHAVVLWEHAARRAARPADRPQRSRSSLSRFSPDGRVLASAGSRRARVRLWDLSARSDAPGPLAVAPHRFTRVAFSLRRLDRRSAAGRGRQARVWISSTTSTVRIDGDRDTGPSRRRVQPRRQDPRDGRSDRHGAPVGRLAGGTRRAGVLRQLPASLSRSPSAPTARPSPPRGLGRGACVALWDAAEPQAGGPGSAALRRGHGVGVAFSPDGKTPRDRHRRQDRARVGSRQRSLGDSCSTAMPPGSA